MQLLAVHISASNPVQQQMEHPPRCGPQSVIRLAGLNKIDNDGRIPGPLLGGAARGPEMLLRPRSRRPRHEAQLSLTVHRYSSDVKPRLSVMPDCDFSQSAQAGSVLADTFQ